MNRGAVSLEFSPELAFSEELKARIAGVQRRFPDAQSALLPALHAVQDELGHVPLSCERRVAELLGVPAERVHEAVTFYSLFHDRPVGRHLVDVCGNISCWLRGFETVKEFLERKLGVGDMETTPDGRFTLRVVECLGMCDHAPVMQVDGVFHGDLTPEKVEAILDGLA